MNNDVLKIMVCVTLPVSIITLCSNLYMLNTVDTMNNIISRQYNLHPNDFVEFSKSLPYVKRTVRFDKVVFNPNNLSNNATVYFYDATTHQRVTQNASCASIRHYLGKSYHVKYDVSANRYQINCTDGFYEK